MYPDNGLLEMLCLVLVLFPLLLSISYSTRFAHQIFKYDSLELFPKRNVESIIVPKHIDDVAYISFSAEKKVNKSQWGNSTVQDHVSCNPIVAMVVLEGSIEILWTTSLEMGMSKTRHTSLALSHDGKKLYVGTTFFNVNETDHKFQVLSLDARDGSREKSVYASTLAGSQIIRATAVNKTGMYICGRSTNATFEEDSNLDSVQSWGFLLCKISFSGRIDWQYTANVTNKTCEDVRLHDGHVFTAGNARVNGTELGVVYKHTAEGALTWGRSVRSTLKLPMRSNELLVNNDGIFLSSHLSNTSTGGKSFVQKFSHRGTLLWSRALAGGVPVGIGFRAGFINGLTAGYNGSTVGAALTRMDKYAESSGTMALNISASVETGSLQGTWVSLSNAFLVTSKTDRTSLYGVGTTDGGVVDDASTGAEEYEIRVTMRLQDADVQAVKDYLAEVTHGGDVRCARREGLVVVVMVVREASRERFTATYERVEARLVKQEDGKSRIERELGVVVDVSGREFGKLETSGSASVGKVGTIVAICVAVGFVVVVVCVWFCVSKGFSFAGEHVGMA